MERGRFPKLTSMPLTRARIDSWLTWYAATPLRYIWAPSGSGKTTAAVLYARSTEHGILYVRMPQSGLFEEFLDAFAKSFGEGIGSEADLFNAFSSDERIEVIIDDVHLADEETRNTLHRLPDELPHTVTLTYLSQTANAVDIVRAVSSGTAVVADISLLNFTIAEIAAYCDALEVCHSAADVTQLRYVSDGWAFAVSGAIREAGLAKMPLRAAYDRWAQNHATVLGEMAARSMVGLSGDERHAAERLYAGESFSNAAMFGALHNSALLLSKENGDLRPLRPFLTAAKRSTSVANRMVPIEVPVATLQLFGEFEMGIEGRRVEWCRRRDRQIVEFLALRPGGRATRQEVIEAFWPEADAHLAGQSLRTACSTIRRAIALCVGYDRVGLYFTVNRELNLHMEHVVSTTQRFREHIYAGDVATDRGDTVTAHSHYTAALRIQRAPLLNSEGPAAPWFAAQAEMFAALAAHAQTRLSPPRPALAAPFFPRLAFDLSGA